MISLLLYTLILTPFLSGLLILLAPHNQEQKIARLAHGTSFLHLLLSFALLCRWIFLGAIPVRTPDITIYSSENFRFFITLLLDWISATFLFALTVVSYLITVYAKTYLGGEEGFKRFFASLMFFVFGYTLVILANNYEVLFAGWEFLGLTSFLLISFYRYRIRPIKNALKIFTIYRVGDVGLLLGAWISQLLWHENITFDRFSEISHLITNSIGIKEGLFLGVLIVLSASAKSAQFPFCYWLPKAMEGPTPSSAIFYGALSIHIGVYVLLRTYPLWSTFLAIRELLIMVGLLSAALAAKAATVQSNIKAQIAYSSLIQVGIIFIEVALGFTHLALFHSVGNAFLRGYQLLVSPSVVSYLIRYHNESPPRATSPSRLQTLLASPKVITSLYMIAIREGFLEQVMESFIWYPIKKIGSFFLLQLNGLVLSLLFLLATSVSILGLSPWANSVEIFTPIVATLAILTSLSALAERESPIRAWMCLGLSQLFVVASVSVCDHFSADHIWVYLSGSIVFWPVGYFVLRRLKEISLNSYLGLYSQSEYSNFLLLLCCLGLSGFPISPGFLGEDLILHHASQDRIWLALVIAFSFIISGIAAIRLYAKLFLGPPRNKSTRSV
ncbi:MAG: hypothetical protein EB078_00260 [Proteobacteria bacterium]|nr:hypothetical protein [Pseudomonadota bacterium]NDC23042.1 hypothetical protein [Pseudomonadota bacterium]NDD03313.1 hypothetical protein [Pseudomonadota bacterium]NDG25937.1 hypothetical protein [Pseudomonadota bacterium]